MIPTTVDAMESDTALPVVRRNASRVATTAVKNDQTKFPTSISAPTTGTNRRSMRIVGTNEYATVRRTPSKAPLPPKAALPSHVMMAEPAGQETAQRAALK